MLNVHGFSGASLDSARYVPNDAQSYCDPYGQRLEDDGLLALLRVSREVCWELG